MIKTMRMNKAIKEYESLAKDITRFSESDIGEIFEMGERPFQLVINALRAGYAIGYRTAKRHLKENALTSAATRARA